MVLIVDALRYDFMFPHESVPEEKNFYRNVLTLPTELSQQEPDNSLMFKFIADPPTATLQRIKALTVGTLPTFVDAGSNFAGSRILEDTWLAQAKRAGKQIAFMGDDTWMGVFPLPGPLEDASGSVFNASMTWPFDSFYVEDLDTVDQGVVTHLYPLLEDPDQEWDILVGHLLGLDHVGHRLGPNHSEMTRKLVEADTMLRRVLKSLREDDLLILMGDHGMDEKGNHGGDSMEETSASLWMYSKKGLTRPSSSAITSPIDSEGHKTVQQISLIPTLSLLLGQPIPFSNLGSIIPELFLDDLHSAVALNSKQMFNFLATYTNSSTNGGDDLRPHFDSLGAMYQQAVSSSSTQDHFAFMEAALAASRSVWAVFNIPLMVLGLSILLLSLPVLFVCYATTGEEGCFKADGELRASLTRAVIGLPSGTVVAGPICFALDLPAYQVLVGSALGTELAFLCFGKTTKGQTYRQRAFVSLRKNWTFGGLLAAALPLLHGLSFASNSFILWEDKMVLYLIQIPLVLLLFQSLLAPQERLRARIAAFGFLSLICLRAISMSTICREEQQPHCNASFNLPSGLLTPFGIGIFLANLASAIYLPRILTSTLDLSQSNRGIAPYFLSIGFRACLWLGSFYWMIEWATGSVQANPILLDALTSSKNIVARAILIILILGIGFVWNYSPLNVAIKQTTPTDPSQKPKVEILGFANALGSSYLLLFSGVFAFLFPLNQPVGQLVMVVTFVIIVAFLESFDSKRDSEIIQKTFQLAAKITPTDAVESSALNISLPPTKFLETGMLALLGFVVFFATGHQAVLSSIQWKVAFVGLRSVIQPISPLLVVLNTVGPFVLTAAAVPLFVFWNVSPSFSKGQNPTVPMMRYLLRSTLGFMIYHTLVALPTAVVAAWLRRHLMVWKVFAPRFMTGALTLLSVDVALILTIIGALVVLGKAEKTFGSRWT